MSEVGLVNIGLVRHLIRCPHCEKQIVHNWPGSMILFATAKCLHCGKGFLIALNRPRAAS
jgi:hypothetical protein